jgi:hypothetical protein
LQEKEINNAVQASEIIHIETTAAKHEISSENEEHKSEAFNERK